MNSDRFVAIDIKDMPTAKHIYDIEMVSESYSRFQISCQSIWCFWNRLMGRRIVYTRTIKDFQFNFRTEYKPNWNPFSFAFKIKQIAFLASNILKYFNIFVLLQPVHSLWNNTKKSSTVSSRSHRASSFESQEIKYGTESSTSFMKRLKQNISTNNSFINILFNGYK